MKKCLPLLFLLIATAASAFGQQYSTSNSKAIKLFEKGQHALFQGHGEEAVSAFTQAVKTDSLFVEAHIMLAEWYLDAKQPELSKRHYYAAVKANPTFFTQAWLQLGELELAAGHNDKARENYQQFLNLDTKNADRHPAASHGIACADFRIHAMQNPVDFHPENLGPAINSADDEYLPALTVDGKTLIFTRRFPRKSTTVANSPEEEDFYTSTLASGQWTPAQRMAEPVNSNDNEGAQCISQDGRIMFFTACGRRDGAGRCDIYMCTRRGDKWSTPRNIGSPVNGGGWESQPTFSIDGKTLYFTSDRKGGYGGLDIWKTVYVGNNGNGSPWSAPQNLGPTVNTPGDEMSPFIHYDDQTLYFCSNGHVGMGGMDLFKTQRLPEGGWTTPVNLGYPINTAGDESNLVVSADAKTAFYSSNREGGLGKQDLYSFELPAPARPNLTFCLTGTASNSENGSPVSAQILVIDINTGDTIAATSSDAQTGKYQISLPVGRDFALHASAKGYLFFSENYDLDYRVEDAYVWEPDQIDIAMKPIKSGERIALRNTFFEIGEHELLEQSKVELDKMVDFLKANPTIRIELGGHTDNEGSDVDNQRLSERRAKAVYDYLVADGISADRLQYKGYGETQPIADNATEEGRSLNRRTEMKIL